MKTKLPGIAFSLALTTLVVANSLQAQTNFIWDPNGTNAGVGGTGTWTTNATFFTTNPAGSSATVSGNFVSAANPRNNAVFEGTAGTVSLGGSTFSGTIFVNSTGYTFQNSSTSGTSANRYFNTTNGILLAEGVNLNQRQRRWLSQHRRHHGTAHQHQRRSGRAEHFGHCGRHHHQCRPLDSPRTKHQWTGWQCKY